MSTKCSEFWIRDLHQRRAVPVNRWCVVTFQVAFLFLQSVVMWSVASENTNLTAVLNEALPLSGPELREFITNRLATNKSEVYVILTKTLRCPRSQMGNEQASLKAGVRWISDAMNCLGTDFCDALLTESRAADHYFKANIVRCVSYWNTKEALELVKECLADFRTSDVTTPLHDRHPRRICDVAYGLLHAKITSFGLAPPSKPERFYDLPVDQRDEYIGQLSVWCAEHQTTIEDALLKIKVGNPK